MKYSEEILKKLDEIKTFSKSAEKLEEFNVLITRYDEFDASCKRNNYPMQCGGNPYWKPKK
tara:strand:+ start:424 stop:606 length:183 start_codon:yes stop_codon:yes gene_type:complete